MWLYLDVVRLARHRTLFCFFSLSLFLICFDFSFHIIEPRLVYVTKLTKALEEFVTLIQRK